MSPFWISFAIAAFFALLEGTASWIFIRGSKKHHPELWKDAGSPSLWGDSNLMSAWPTSRYLLNREYMSLNNSADREFAERWRMPMLIGYFGTAIAVVAFLLCLIFYGQD